MIKTSIAFTLSAIAQSNSLRGGVEGRRLDIWGFGGRDVWSAAINDVWSDAADQQPQTCVDRTLPTWAQTQGVTTCAEAKSLGLCDEMPVEAADFCPQTCSLCANDVWGNAITGRATVGHGDDVWSSGEKLKHQGFVKALSGKNGGDTYSGDTCLDALLFVGLVHLWGCDTNDQVHQNRHWTYNPQTGQIKATYGKCLDASERNNNGGKVHMWDCNTSNQNQQWTYNPLTGQIKAKHGKCLDASERNKQGGKVHMWDCLSATDPSVANQQWKFDPATGQILSGSSYKHDAIPAALFPPAPCSGSSCVLTPHAAQQLLVQQGAPSAAWNAGMRSVIIPVGYTAIGDRAFYSAAGGLLERAVLPPTIAIVGREAFSATHLEQINFPSSLTTLADKAFFGSTLVVDGRVVPTTLITIGSRAFPRDNYPGSGTGSCPTLANAQPSKCTDAKSISLEGRSITYMRFMQINCPISCYNHEQETARNRYINFRGYWKLASREIRSRTISQAVCRDRSSTNSFARSVSSSLTISESITSSAKFGDFGGVEASIEVSRERGTNTEWARDVTKGVSKCSETTETTTCDHGTRCESDEFAYQFVTEGTRASGQKDIVGSCDVVCVAGDTPHPHAPKCPYQYCDKLGGCQCCSSNKWAAPSQRAQVPVCARQCVSGPGTATAQCEQFVSQQRACAGTNGDFSACLARQCSGCSA